MAYKINNTTFEDTMYGATHNHTEDSRFDGAATCSNMFKRAKAMGAQGLAITEHGFMTSVEHAKAASAETGVKYIPGFEGYLKDETQEFEQREHMLLLSKNLDGYHANTLAVTESNSNMDDRGFPCLNWEILNKYYGPGSIGHGNVIATSACMSGIIASTLLMNQSVEKAIGKLEEKKAKLNNPESKAYLNACDKIAKIDAELAEISANLPVMDKKAKTPFTKKEKTLKTFEGTPEYDQRKAEFDAEKAECAEAGKKVEEMKARRTALKLEQKRLKDGIKPTENDKEKYFAICERIDTLRKEIVSDDEIYAKALARTKQFAELFGEGNFYCELQYHGIEEERIVMPIIAKIAKELNLPVVAANDAHIVSNTTDELKTRELIRGLRFNKWEPMDEADKEMYLKSDAELAEALHQIIDGETVIAAMNGIKAIVDACNVEFKSEPHYPKFKSEIEGEDAEMRLRRLSREGIAWRYPDNEGWTAEHEERLEYELGVIAKLGFCDYLCIVEDFLSYGRLLGKIDINDPRFIADPYNISNLKELAKDNVGLGVGPGRGSAVGSLVCYLIGITGIDPMKYGLIFERFLNVERVSMPDIDSDFKTDIRDKVLDYVKHVYGEEAVCCIMTRGTQAAKASIRNAARLLGSEKFNDTAHFLSLGDAIAKKIPTEVGIKLADCKADIMKEFGGNAYAVEILNNALLMEGSFVNVGMHAAGVIIADNGDVKQYVPLMWNKDKEQWMTQCEKDPCEANGLLKMDVRLVR